ncbi:MAG: hypothetical protein ABSH35_08030 [Isosphaeraceae bacterium]
MLTLMHAAIHPRIVPKSHIFLFITAWRVLVSRLFQTRRCGAVKKPTSIRWSEALSLTVGARALGANYNRNNVANQDGGLLGERARRDDWLYTIALGVQYNINPNASVNLGYSYDLAVNTY